MRNLGKGVHERWSPWWKELETGSEFHFEPQALSLVVLLGRCFFGFVFFFPSGTWFLILLKSGWCFLSHRVLQRPHGRWGAYCRPWETVFATSLYFTYSFLSLKKTFFLYTKNDSLTFWAHRSGVLTLQKQEVSQSGILRTAALISPWACWKSDFMGPTPTIESEPPGMGLKKMCYSKFLKTLLVTMCCTVQSLPHHVTVCQKQRT